MGESQREEQFMASGWSTLSRRCGLVLGELRVFQSQMMPVVALMMATAALGLALAAFVAITNPLGRSPLMPAELPAWVQIDAAPFAFTVVYLGASLMILLVAASVTGDLDQLEALRSALLKTCDPTVASRVQRIMKDNRGAQVAREVHASFCQLEYMLEQLQDKEGQIFAFIAVGRVPPVKVARLLYVCMLPVLFLLQAWLTDKIQGQG